MTPEFYMRRYHSADDEDSLEALSCPIAAEDAFPVFERRSQESAESECRCLQAQGSGEGECRRCQEQEDEDDNGCCCKRSMVEALRLLCNNTLASLVDFDSFFFLTDSLAVGSTLAPPSSRADNINDPNASFRRFSPCNCDLLDVSATAYFASPSSETVALEAVEQLSLCALKAVAFQLKDSECPRDCDDSNFSRAIRVIRRAIREEGGSTNACGRCSAHCDCDNCCCNTGILSELSVRNLSRLATLTVGPLILQNVAVLGSLGSVLILADEEQERFYLVCAENIEALG